MQNFITSHKTLTTVLKQLSIKTTTIKTTDNMHLGIQKVFKNVEEMLPK